MAKQVPPLLSFNRGEVSRHALARVDVDKLRLSAERQENWMPYVLGPMMLRPGLQYIGAVAGDKPNRLIPFVFSNSDVALIELTPNLMRVWSVADDSETLVTRGSVTTTIVNGDFSSPAGWDLTSGTTSGASAVIANNVLTLTCAPIGGRAQCTQQISSGLVGIGTPHAVKIVVERGPIRFYVGSASGGTDLIAFTTLDTGTHSLSFTPASAIYLHIESTDPQEKIVASVTVEPGGPMDIETTWDEDDLRHVRFDQSGDIIFCACAGQKQRKIERRAVGSWSFADYESGDGPFQAFNRSDITLTPEHYFGNTTLTAEDRKSVV